MTVVDASALLEFLLQTPLGLRIETRLFDDGDDLHAPHLIDVELAQALRRLVRAGDVTAARAEEALIDLGDLNLRRYAHAPLIGRAWDLRENLTAYDAMYVALAEGLDAPLVTCDGALGDTPGHDARIEVIRG